MSGHQPCPDCNAVPCVCFDYDESDCWNCGGEGLVYGCSWDWQCDTYDEGEGTCLCTRRCDICQPSKPNPELQRILADALTEPAFPAPSQHPNNASHDPAGRVGDNGDVA